jgi:hypothetical protein
VGAFSPTDVIKQILGFTWVDGNPHSLGPYDPGWGMYMCPGAQNPNTGTDYLKIGKKDSEYLSGCVKVMFIISAIK